MNYDISQNKLTDEIKKKIYRGFSRQAMTETGMDGLAEEPVSFEVYDPANSEFIGAIVVQTFWEQLHIKYLFVEEKYRDKGIGRRLMEHALTYGRERGYHFAFVETMSFQAPSFYQKFGFEIEFSRSGYARKTTFHYLKKNLINSNEFESPYKQMTRVGVYGVAQQEGRILVVEQQKGPFAGKFDFPGGRIEFGESAEQALCREFAEEVGMTFDSMNILDNLTATTNVPSIDGKDPFLFYQIGIIYKIEGLELIKEDKKGDIKHQWVASKSLNEGRCSSLLWKYISLNN